VRFRVRVWVFRHKLGIAPLRNVLTDRKYGGWSGGSRTSTHADLGANLFGSVHYYELPRIFSARNGLEITPSDVLVDIGCGKGRVINWWLGLGLGNRIIGLEIEELLAIEARKRLQRYRMSTSLPEMRSIRCRSMARSSGCSIRSPSGPPDGRGWSS